jgi:hypothetical protein
MVYNNEEITEPFWADYPSSASGRDPLAIQNSSVVIYTKMMVGITNVTNRIRYNGFYCWLLQLILQKTKVKGSVNEQIQFIRRAELLIAYMMVNEFPGITGVSGSLFASKNVGEHINLSDGADWGAKIPGHVLYWTFKGGVFGQYYSGVVRELGLINHPSTQLNIYTVTNNGMALANHFDSNLPDGLRETFWGYIFKGKLNLRDLAGLTPFALHQIPESSEAVFYRQMLLSRDDRSPEPTSYRKQTIKLLLKSLSGQVEGTTYLPYIFLKENYKRHISLSQLSKNAATAWYIYELNEVLHVTLEHFHCSLLWSIDVYPSPLDERLDWLVKQGISTLEDTGHVSDSNSFGDILSYYAAIKADMYTHFDSMQTAFKEGQTGVCLSEALFCLACVYRDCQSQLSQIEELAVLPKYNFNRQGYAVLLLDDLISSRKELLLDEYMRTVFQLVINLHVFSSYSKTRVGQSLVHNYFIEDGMIWRARETTPRRTTPRLQNTVQYICDVGWVSYSENQLHITELGKTLLANEI